MNASFGLDHPLLATHDIEGLRDRLVSLGFNMTAVGRHPWGTSTSLAMFDGCLIEIMGIYDASLIDEVPAGSFRFGRHVYEHLQAREGVALSALHSTDSVADAAFAQTKGYSVAGHLEFGRDVVLPDGTSGRTKTTLALLPDADFPRLSFFLCQQHRPDLIYVPEWLRHPNRVTGICTVNAVAAEDFHTPLRKQLRALYGAARPVEGGFEVQTANGVFRVMTPAAFASEIGPLPALVTLDQTPCIAGMDLRMSDPATMKGFLEGSKMGYRAHKTGFALTEPERTANTILRFIAE